MSVCLWTTLKSLPIFISHLDVARASLSHNASVSRRFLESDKKIPNCDYTAWLSFPNRVQERASCWLGLWKIVPLVQIIIPLVVLSTCSHFSRLYMQRSTAQMKCPHWYKFSWYIFLRESGSFHIFIASHLMPGHCSCTLWGWMRRPFLPLLWRVWPSRLSACIWAGKESGGASKGRAHISYCCHCSEARAERSATLNMYTIITVRACWIGVVFFFFYHSQ